jgi:hypothetical protein
MYERGWRWLFRAGTACACLSAGLWCLGAFHVCWNGGARYVNASGTIRYGLCVDEGLFQFCNRLCDDHEGWWRSPEPPSLRTLHWWPSRRFPLADAYRKPDGPSTWGWSVSLPLWMPAALGLAVAAWGGMAARRLRRRRVLGHCISCGYDRRSLVGGADAKCPECGTVPVPASK